jgi:hypothetical protein
LLAQAIHKTPVRAAGSCDKTGTAFKNITAATGSRSIAAFGSAYRNSRLSHRQKKSGIFSRFRID